MPGQLVAELDGGFDLSEEEGKGKNKALKEQERAEQTPSSACKRGEPANPQPRVPMGTKHYPRKVGSQHPKSILDAWDLPLSSELVPIHQKLQL